jgi:PucR family transcriptional regulator, purine catabolism regulatory protein
LHIHRQTLVYRLKSVEQLTGLKPTSTVGTTSLWIALQAARAAGILPDTPAK